MQEIGYEDSIILGKIRSPQAILETHLPVASFILKNKDGVPSVYRPVESYRSQFGFEVLALPLRSEEEESLFLQHKIPYDIIINVDGAKESSRMFHSGWLYETRSVSWGIEVKVDDPRYEKAMEMVEKIRAMVYAATEEK